MSDKLDLRAGEEEFGMERDQVAHTRFENNRRYDQRPAIENLDRPTMVVTTRDVTPPRRTWSAGFVTAALGVGLLVLAVGVLIGVLLQRPISQSSTIAAPDPALGASGNDPEVAGTDPAVAAGPDVEAGAGDEPPAEAATAAPDGSVETQGITGDESQTAQLDRALAGLDLSRFNFEPGTAQLTPAGRAAASDLAVVLSQTPNEPVEILVRTFSESTPGLNHGLSLQQADVILAELEADGVNPQRLSSVGLGSSGSEKPAVAAALRLETTDGVLAEMVLDHGPVILETSFGGSFSAPTVNHLAAVGEFLGEHPGVEVSLVGYAWSEGTADGNHEASHHILDAARAQLVASGASVDQASLVGLGEVNIPLGNRATEVVVETGSAAIIGVSLGYVELDAVDFEAGTDTLSGDGQTALENVAGILALDPSVRVEVAVHTYSEDSSQANHDLSQKQGDVIVNYLIDEGIAPSQLQLVWHGDPPHFSAPGRLGAVTFTVIR